MHLISEHSPDYIVYRFSTHLFDCFESGRKHQWLREVKDKMGEKFYYDVIEGYVLGEHDT